MHNISNKNNIILRLPDVIKLTGLKRSSIYAYEKSGNFPNRITISSRCVGWISEEINAWISDRIQNSRKTTNSEVTHHGK